MGVDRQGIAWVVFMDGTLFRVDTASAACELSPYPTDQLGWLTFGMAFAATTDAGSSDALFVAESSYQHASLGLGRIDLTSFALKAIGPFAPPLSNAVELTGTGDGRLYAFSLNSGAAGSHLSQIDETSGKILGDVSLPTVGTPNSSFAFAYWGGDFYFFTAPQSAASTTVTRYRPGDGSVTPVASLAETVVGVGVSTCAPQ
jgi:hypothetical protein